MASSENLGGQRHDLHELLGAQLARDRAEDAGADGLQLGVEQHCRVAVELDQRAILAADAFGGTHHHGVVDLALFDAATRRCFLDADLDDIAHAGVATLGAAEHLDAHHGLGTRVVSNIESRLRLDHLI